MTTCVSLNIGESVWGLIIAMATLRLVKIPNINASNLSKYPKDHDIIRRMPMTTCVSLNIGESVWGLAKTGMAPIYERGVNAMNTNTTYGIINNTNPQNHLMA